MKSFAKARRRCEGRVKMYLGTEGYQGVKWILVAQRGENRGTAMNPVMNSGYLCNF